MRWNRWSWPLLVGISAIPIPALGQAAVGGAAITGGSALGLPITPPESASPATGSILCEPPIGGWGWSWGFRTYGRPLIGFGIAWRLVPSPPPPRRVLDRVPQRAGPALQADAIARGLERAIPPNRPATARPTIRTGHGDSTKAEELTTLGDRVFRAKNLRRATERYEQAIRVDPEAPGPRVGLAQIAIVRGRYAEAANLFREAQAADPRWLDHAPDVQAAYAEPTDFAEPIARLETHLQVHPEDEDGWLVLGAQLYLSRRVQQAADVFRRLGDRPTDPTLATFLAASQAPASR